MNRVKVDLCSTKLELRRESFSFNNSTREVVLGEEDGARWAHTTVVVDTNNPLLTRFTLAYTVKRIPAPSTQMVKVSVQINHSDIRLFALAVVSATVVSTADNQTCEDLCVAVALPRMEIRDLTMLRVVSEEGPIFIRVQEYDEEEGSIRLSVWTE